MKEINQTIRIGIIGTGRITDRFMREATFVPGISIAAVFNPRKSSAEAFGKKYSVKAFDQLGAFWDEIDAAYVAAPHEYHTMYTREALLSGKHVLCEKPFSLSGEEAAELYALACEKKLILMEAIKTACAPGFQGLLKLLQEGAIGKVHDIEACFSKLTPANAREYWTDYRGSLIELGSYSLFPIVRILGTEPVDVSFHSIKGCNGADTYTKVTFDYENATATAKTGLGVKSEGELIVAGSRGYIRVEAPWWLTRHIEVHHEDPNQVESYDYPYEESGLRYEILAFLKKIITLQKMQEAHKEAEVLDSIWDYLEGIEGVTPEESVWLSCILEQFLEKREEEQNKPLSGMVELQPKPVHTVGIWAHRGCSMYYPENTLIAFEQAAKITGIKGIELDVQMTSDGTLVVINDETVNRTTNGTGNVRDYSLADLQKLLITGSGNDEVYSPIQWIPTLNEVFALLKSHCEEDGLLINIELKNSVYRYEGMEEKVLQLVHEYGLEKNVIYSSFLPESMKLIRELEPEAETGILGGDIHECLRLREKMDAQAVHPSIAGLEMNMEIKDLLKEGARVIPVRAYNGEEPFFGQDRELKEHTLTKYAELGVMDVITNVPELYL